MHTYLIANFVVSIGFAVIWRNDTLLNLAIKLYFFTMAVVAAVFLLGR